LAAYFFELNEINPYFVCYKESDTSQMRLNILRKAVVALIIFLPLFSYSGCKKQEKCGCDGDVLFSYTRRILNYSDIHYDDEGKSASFRIGYDTYSFCNPGEMFDVYKSLSSENQIKISGDVFWDCSYLINSGSSSSYYYNYYKYYQINVTELISQMYGK
jgi:hypothetical protein